jgi:hypothetical protein
MFVDASAMCVLMESATVQFGKRRDSLPDTF